MPNPKTIAICNQKGGVGKTTTALNLGVGIGQDYREKINALPYFDEGSDTEALMMLVEMTDPLCPEFYDWLRSRGFIFTGCVPGGTGDLIVMEHLRHPIYRDYLCIEPDYEKILDRLYEINGADMK